MRIIRPPGDRVDQGQRGDLFAGLEDLVCQLHRNGPAKGIAEQRVWAVPADFLHPLQVPRGNPGNLVDALRRGLCVTRKHTDSRLQTGLTEMLEIEDVVANPRYAKETALVVLGSELEHLTSAPG